MLPVVNGFATKRGQDLSSQRWNIGFVQQRKVLSPFRSKAELAEKLWKLSERFTGVRETIRGLQLLERR